MPLYSPPTQPLYVERYGAVGDGVADDTVALLAAAASGNNIYLTPGKIYLHRRALTMNTNGTTLYGNGATLKRAAQGVTTTTTAITANTTTSITLSSTSGFQVNDQVVIEQSGTYDALNPTITSIVGNVITVTPAFGISLSGTTNVRTAWAQVIINGDDCRMTGVVLDGNSSNWSWARWQHTCGVFQFSSPTYSQHGRVLIDHNRIINQPGDGASPGGYHVIFAYNDVENIKGRGISWAGSAGPSDVGGKCLYNRFYNCEIDTTVSGLDGHGNIQMSSNTQDLLIHGNQIDTGGVGIGSINTTDNSDVTITNNVIRNITTNAIEGNCSSGTNHADNVVISNNRIYSSGKILLANGGVAGNGGPSRWSIKNNLLVETTIQLSSAYDVTVQGNTFQSAGALLTFIQIGGGTANAIYVSVIGNTFEGGAYAMDVQTNASQIVIANNICIGQATAGIRASSCSYLTITKNLIKSAGGTYGINLDTNIADGDHTLVEGNTLEGQHTGGINVAWSTASISIKNNQIINDGNADSNNYYGILVVSALEIIGNTVNFSVGAGQGVGVFGTVVGVVIKQNKITGGGNTSVLVLGGSTSNAVITNNIFDHAISDSGSNNTKSGNIVNGGPLSGRAVLVAGTVTVTNAEVRTGDSILLSNVVKGGTVGTLSIGTITQGTSFVINSSSNTDTSTTYWKIEH
jgi:hypothetical protein